MEPSVTLFGPLDQFVGPYIQYVVLVLAVASFLTRKLAFDAHKRTAAEVGDDEAIRRYPLHVAVMWGLVLTSLYYLTLHHHSGVVLSALVIGMFISDFFEFEAYRVDVREDRPLDRPKAAIVANVFVLLYAAYISVFFVVAPLWNAVV